MSGCDIRLVFAFPPKDSTAAVQKNPYTSEITFLALVPWFWYSFDTAFYQFLETGTTDRCLIGIVQNLKFLGFILYSLSFFLYSHFKSLTLLIPATINITKKDCLNLSKIR